MSRLKRSLTLTGSGIILLVAAVAVYAILTDPNGQPHCHKQVDMAFHNWQAANETTEFPNVNGSSKDSQATIIYYLGGADLHDRYMYVPGLQRDDPGELVLMYMRQPTRWTWHGRKPSIFRDTAWILVPVDMKSYGHVRDAGPGECSERVPFNELRRRLENTLEFLKKNKRPNWQAVVEEHSQFLKGIEEEPDS